MARHAQARKGARRKQARPAWVRPFRRARRAITASVLLIEAALRTIADSERCVHGQRPIRASLNLDGAFARVAHAANRLTQAMRELARSNECWAGEAGGASVPASLIEQTARWIQVTARLTQVAADVNTLHHSVLDGLESGAFVPEADAFRRRITVVPRPAPVRAFLRARLPRLKDRITPILRRRRRTPRPAGLRVPRRSVLGRAPPLSPVCPR